MIFFLFKFTTHFTRYHIKLIVHQCCTKLRNTLFFFNKNVVFPAQAEHSYFSANFRQKIFLYYC